ncbi:4'-phosphopantetheinyl transferase superfamily protein [Streptomyces flaveolus]|uniref:4'-phosphopantetheinyl transferase superfamily protein n=1 Tax=Streptomyces flaveolus TaxID=67297 RepID=A0ABV3AI95_9ACTN
MTHATDGAPPPAAPGAAAVDLWLLRFPGPHSVGRRLAVDELDARERARAASFRRPWDALLYTAAHIALRRLLAARLGLPPREVTYIREPCPGCGDPHGRPALRPRPGSGPPGLHFSLSHSSGRALLGLATVPVGVDIQRIPAATTTEVCTRLLHPGERAELAELPPERLAASFAQLWARKEAYLKGLGTGLGRPPHLDYLGTPGPGRPGPAGWTVRDLPCGPAHRAAVAVKGAPDGPWTVRPLPEEWLDEQTPGRPPEQHTRPSGPTPAPHGKPHGSTPAPHGTTHASTPTPHGTTHGPTPAPHGKPHGPTPTPHGTTPASTPAPHGTTPASTPAPHGTTPASTPTPHGTTHGPTPTPHGKPHASTPTPHGTTHARAPHGGAHAHAPTPHENTAGNTPAWPENGSLDGSAPPAPAHRPPPAARRPTSDHKETPL